MSRQALKNYQESFRELTVANHDTWWLLVRAQTKPVVSAGLGPSYQACGSQSLWRRCSHVRCVVVGRSQHSRERPQVLGSTGQVAADDSGPPKPNRVRESAPASATVRDSTHPQELNDCTVGTRFAESGRVHTTSAATRARVRCRTSASTVYSPTGWRLALCSRGAKPIVLQRTTAAGSDFVLAVRECHTLPRRQPVTLRCGPQVQRRRVAANRMDRSRCTLSLCFLAVQTPRGSRQWNPCRHYRRRRR